MIPKRTIEEVRRLLTEIWRKEAKKENDNFKII